MQLRSLTLLAPLLLAGCGGSSEDAGAAAIRPCLVCHDVSRDGRSRIGPNLHGIIGRAAGTQPGFPYSAAMKGSGIIWSAETLDAFIAAPQRVVPGNSMGAAPVTDPLQRAAIIEELSRVP